MCSRGAGSGEESGSRGKPLGGGDGTADGSGDDGGDQGNSHGFGTEGCLDQLAVAGFEAEPIGVAGFQSGDRQRPGGGPLGFGPPGLGSVQTSVGLQIAIGGRFIDQVAGPIGIGIGSRGDGQRGGGDRGNERGVRGIGQRIEIEAAAVPGPDRVAGKGPQAVSGVRGKPGQGLSEGSGLKDAGLVQHGDVDIV